MPTAAPSDAKTKGRPQRQGPGLGAGGNAPVAGVPAGRRRRRVPVLPLALVGAGLATGYGMLVLGMRAGPPLVIVALGGLTLVLGAVALWRVVDPLTRDDAGTETETRAPHRRRELEREKQAVLKAIKEIELDFQMRKISEADYREMVERYRTRALRVLGDLAAGDDYRALIERELKDRLAARAAAGTADEIAAPALASAAVPGPVPAAAPAVPAGPAACGACGAPNDADAQFCKRCGKPLTPPPATPA